VSLRTNFTAHMSRWNYLRTEMGPEIVISRLKGQQIIKKTNNFILLPPACYSVTNWGNKFIDAAIVSH
jgi:hypothetical protein